MNDAFHATCYRRFIDKKRLDAAEKRTTQCSALDLCCLPCLCIICKKTDKYITVAGKRHKDHLTQAETTSPGM